MSQAIVIAGGMGRAIDAAVVGAAIVMALIASGIWLVVLGVRKANRWPILRGEWWGFALFWVLVIGFVVYVWEGGRIADERRHKQMMEEWDEDLPQTPSEAQ